MSSTNDLVKALEHRFVGYEVVLSTTDAGGAILGELGADWIGAVVDSLLMCQPGVRLELVLAQSDAEPLAPGGRVQPGTAGGMFVDARAVGRLTLAPASADAPVLKRILSLPGPALLAGDSSVVFGAGRGRVGEVVGRAYGSLYRRAPLALDMWKQARNSRALGRSRDMHPRASAIRGGRLDGPGVDHVPTAWFAMHWLEPGGAEVWALDAAQIAKDLGYRVVITADVAAPQRWLDRALAIADHVYLPSNVLDEGDWGAFLRGLVRAYEPDLLHIHHAGRAYAFLPELRHLAPHTLVVDSTHIVEHRTGGFVRQSVEYSNLIDHHHVISPELRDLYLLDARVPAERVHYHPLTHGQSGGDAAARPTRSGPLRIGFLGRISAQKRPFLFVEVARRLHHKDPDAFTFVIQGSGPFDEYLDGQIRAAGLTGVIERRPWGSAEDLLRDVDVLVIPSDNEGLTLTSLEADRQGVLVVSADVGSQATVVPREVLLPREPRAFCRRAVHLLRELSKDPDRVETALADQHRLVGALRELQNASDFLRSLLQSHLESVR